MHTKQALCLVINFVYADSSNKQTNTWQISFFFSQQIFSFKPVHLKIIQVVYHIKNDNAK
eukprot:m.13033 g.13033  ORF g.13033 m.13033 type:complete len:60 (-) comp4774_c0_seq1:57-236(-)